MRSSRSLAVVAVALSAVVSGATGCSSSSCKTGTLAAKVFLTPPINLDGDKLVVTSVDPLGLDLGATVSGALSSGDGLSVELAFPHGYRPDVAVTIEGQAFAGPVLLGQGTATIHTSARCSEVTLYVLPLSKFPPPEPDPDGGI